MRFLFSRYKEIIDLQIFYSTHLKKNLYLKEYIIRNLNIFKFFYDNMTTWPRFQAKTLLIIIALCLYLVWHRGLNIFHMFSCHWSSEHDALSLSLSKTNYRVPTLPSCGIYLDLLYKFIILCNLSFSWYIFNFSSKIERF